MGVLRKFINYLSVVVLPAGRTSAPLWHQLADSSQFDKLTMTHQ